jgi:hypothetical protein
MEGTHNDQRVATLSCVCQMAEGQAPTVNFGINDNTDNKGYYLADGIYPYWSTFVKTIPEPNM